MSAPIAAVSAAVRVWPAPEPPSRPTSGVAASSAALTGRCRRAQGWPGGTTTTSRSCPMTRLRSDRGALALAMNPRSAVPSVTCVMTPSALDAVRVISTSWLPRSLAAAR
jgi:hypothetical protein